jgi:hypothetical protein
MEEIAFDQRCEEVLPQVTLALQLAGYRVTWTFDLRTALSSIPECNCRYHGTTHCDCQYMILLISSDTERPATLILHGHGLQTWVTLADTPAQRVNSMLETAILNIVSLCKD